nr:uncharacterized protein I206_06981 [Kwoniella pini CBS 10737]OCF47203.1 hypothetical protein I206_06981 [Kwoniella pini CBS 10737]
MARDPLLLNTFADVVRRDKSYWKATDVVTVLRSLGSKSSNRDRGVVALCNYIEGKRNKGKNDEEIRKKIDTLQSMVPTDLKEVFWDASRQTGLALKTDRSLPSAPTPRPQPRPPFGTSSTLNSACCSSKPYLPRRSMTTDIYSTPQSDDSDLEPLSTTSTASFSPTSTISSLPSAEDSSSLSSRASSSSSFFSSPCSSSSWASSPYTPESPHTPCTNEDVSLGLTSYIGRAPSMLSPLEIGGWGRQWEKTYFDRSTPLTSKAQLTPEELSLKRFPIPPDYLPVTSYTDSLKDLPISEEDIRNRIFRTEDQTLCPKSPVFDEGNILPTKSTLKSLDDSWLSFSDDKLSSISGAGLSYSLIPHPDEDADVFEENRQHDEIIRARMAPGMDDGEETITGIESSRWSAIFPRRNESKNANVEEHQRGPTEASLIRDAYLRMILPQPSTNCKMSSIPGPEQGDSHTILMAYA